MVLVSLIILVASPFWASGRSAKICLYNWWEPKRQSSIMLFPEASSISCRIESKILRRSSLRILSCTSTLGKGLVYKAKIVEYLASTSDAELETDAIRSVDPSDAKCLLISKKFLVTFAIPSKPWHREFGLNCALFIKWYRYKYFPVNANWAETKSSINAVT